MEKPKAKVIRKMSCRFRAPLNKHDMIAGKTVPRMTHSRPYLLAFFGVSGPLIWSSLPLTAHIVVGISWVSCPPQAREQDEQTGVVPREWTIRRLIIHRGPRWKHWPQSHPLDLQYDTCYSALQRTGKPARFGETGMDGSTQSVPSWNTIFSSIIQTLNGVRLQCYSWSFSVLTGIFTHKRAHNHTF